jgi:NADPH-dependent 2,4-dienoyl-CoA reductase/sulfur reductase-like enzyme
VTDLDPLAGTASLGDGTVLDYDRLLLATGGLARELPQAAGIDGVHVLRSLADCRRLAPELSAGRSVLVVGAGLIGAEVAASARMLGCEVEILEAAATPMSRVLPERLSRVYVELHRAHGVALHTTTQLASLHRDGPHVVAEATDGRRFVAEVVVVGIGMDPDVDLAHRAGIAVDNGILVDEFCETSVPGIFAAGDVANHVDPLRGGRQRVEHWQNAQHQGAVAAKNMLGHREPFIEVPWCWSDQYDVNLQIAGWPSPADEVHVRGDLDAFDALAIIHRDGLTTGAVGLNRGEEVRAIRGVLARDAFADVWPLLDDTADLGALAAAASVTG